MKIISTIFALIMAFGVFGQQIEKAKSGPFILKNASVHSVSNGVFKADILIEGNIIKKIGNGLSTENATIIDCSNKRIYPGFIDGGTKLGLAEISAVSLTQDHNEIGRYTPHMKALTAVNPNSVNIPVTRVNGVTTVLAEPSGGLFPGTAALIHLHGYTPEQMYAGFEAVILNFPSSGKSGWRDDRTEEERKKDFKSKLEKLNTFWKDAVVHAKIDSAARVQNKSVVYNPQLDALKNVIQNDEKMIVNVNKKSDILECVKWVNENKLNVILSGVKEGWRVADTLAKYDIPVIAGPVLSLPARDSDRYDVAYKNPSLIAKAGVKLAIKTTETENVRNLAYHAGFAANYGMGVDAAVAAVTLEAARIFGLEDQIGSIEEGKIANLFVSDGDPFETKTQIEHLFINGWKIPIESRHTLLYDEFLEREPGLDSKN